MTKEDMSEQLIFNKWGKLIGVQLTLIPVRGRSRSLFETVKEDANGERAIVPRPRSGGGSR